MASRRMLASSMIIIMLLATISGCFGEENDTPQNGDLSVDVEMMTGGVFQDVEFKAKVSMSVFIPYLLIDPVTGFVQNSTVIDLKSGEQETISILAPPRADTMIFMFGEMERQNWPIRHQAESWVTWMSNGGDSGD